MEAYANRGLAYSRKGDYKSAVADFTQMVQLDPTNASAYSFRAQAYGNSGRDDKAIEDFTKAMKLDPTMTPLCSLLRGQSCLRTKDYAQAVADFSEALRQKPDSTVALAFRGQAHAGLGKHEKAISDFSEVIRRNPRNAEIYYRRSLSYAQIGQASRAKADRDKARSLDPNIEKKIAQG